MRWDPLRRCFAALTILAVKSMASAENPSKKSFGSCGRVEQQLDSSGFALPSEPVLVSNVHHRIAITMMLQVAQ